MKRRQLIYSLLLLVLITASGCMPGDGKHTFEAPAGFFWGIWHGWIAPLSLVWKLFDPNIRIYEPYNTGWWYDCGFYLAVISGFGGLSFRRGRVKQRCIKDE